MEGYSRDHSLYWIVNSETVCPLCVTQHQRDLAGVGVPLQDGSKYSCQCCGRHVIRVGDKVIFWGHLVSAALEICDECSERIRAGIPRNQIKAELKDKIPVGRQEGSSDTGYTCSVCNRWIPTFSPRQKGRILI